MRPQRHHQRRGFTLVELLVVVGVIAVLIGVLLPALGRARAQANLSKCQSNLRSVYQALLMYASEHRDRLPGNATTLGNHPFRAAPGRTMPGRSRFEECYGLPALLHGISPPPPGSTPPWKVLPLPAKPRYISGLSEVWICPDAPERVSKWGNTYWWTLAAVETYSMQKRHRLTINADSYNASYETRTLYLADNISQGAGLTGFNGPFTGSSGADPYSFPTKIYPHRKPGYQGGFNNLALNGEIVTDWVK